MPFIERIPSSLSDDSWKFSILIPSWNNLEFLQLCIRSIQQHSAFKHQIIIHVNDGSDGTLAWVKEKGFDYTYSKENAGICYPLNYGRTLMKTDYLVYINDDMYMLPNWDAELWAEVQRQKDEFFFISSTMIEPVDTANPCVIGGKDFGKTVTEFKETQLLAEYASWPMADWAGSTWPPNIIHKNLWDLVGGYSVEFSPGFYSDPDFSMKLWKTGVRHFKGIAASRVYHFGSKTTKKIVANNGRRQFLVKWGISSGVFSKYFLRRGEAWSHVAPLEISEAEENSLRKKGFLKQLWAKL